MPKIQALPNLAYGTVPRLSTSHGQVRKGWALVNAFHPSGPVFNEGGNNVETTHGECHHLSLVRLYRKSRCLARGKVRKR